MPLLHKREKVLVQYRLLKDFDELRRRGIPGIDVRVMEDNIYEWHVTMSPISGHFCGLRLHLILLFPEDYPRRPPKVELCTPLPHANVFRDFTSFAGYFAGYKPVRGVYVICTDLLQDRAPPLDPNDSRRYEGWSVSYSVEAVLVQLQCLLFDDFLQQEDGNYVNTLWDHFYSTPGQGRKSRLDICSDLHDAQVAADKFVCHQCGYSGWDDTVAFYDERQHRQSKDAEEEDDDEGDEDGEDEGEEEEEEDEEAPEGREGDEGDPGEPRGQPEEGGAPDGQEGPPDKQRPRKKPKHVSRKRQRKLALQKANKASSTKVDFKAQNLYMEISNSNSALLSGHALKRIPGVFKLRDMVSFHFHGVEDAAYINGHRNINRDLEIFNYGHALEFPWLTYDIMTGKHIYHKEEPEEQEGHKKENKGKASWERFANSQGGGSDRKPEDTPGTAEYVQKREKFFPVGVVEYVNAYQGTVTIVVSGSDGRMGWYGGYLTNHGGPFMWNSEDSNNLGKATLHKNVPMEKVTLHGYENKGFVPYDNPPPSNYKPFVGKYADDSRVEYDLDKDMPVRLVKLVGDDGSSRLTKQKLATLPEGAVALSAGAPGRAGLASSSSAPHKSKHSASSAWEVVGGPGAEESSEAPGGSGAEHGFEVLDAAGSDSFEILSALGDSAASSYEVLSSLGGAAASSFDIISVVESSAQDATGSDIRSKGKGAASVSSSFHIVPTVVSYELFSHRSDASQASFPPAVASAAVVVDASAGSSDKNGGARRLDSLSQASSQVSNQSLVSLRNPSISVNSSDANKSWELLKVLRALNLPVRGVLRSVQNFGVFFDIDSTPRDLAIRNQELLPAGKKPPKGKGRGKGGKGKGKDSMEKVLQDGLLPYLPYMRTSWPSGTSAGSDKSTASVMVTGNVFDDLCKEDALMGPQDMTVYINDVDADRRRLKLSLQPRLSFEDLNVGEEYNGIVVDCSKQATLGSFVALSDDLVGLLPRSQLGVGEFSESTEANGWRWQRCKYRVGDRLRVWVLRKKPPAEGDAEQATGARRKFKIDLTMDPESLEMRQFHISKFLQVLDEDIAVRHSPDAAAPSSSGRTAMDLQVRHTYEAEDKYFLIKNNRIIHEAEHCYPELVIDYTTDPPPPPPAEDKEKPFDFSLINGWSVRKITEEHKRLLDKEEAYKKADKSKPAKDLKPLAKDEEKLLTVLKKKVEEWGKEYYDRITKKVEDHHKRIMSIYDELKAERDKYPYKSVIDLGKFRELTERIKEKQYDSRCCYVTRLSYKEDVLGVGLEIVPEADTGRNVFKCSFDLISKEGFHDFGVRTGVWKDKIQFWMPAAIDASHFRRALPHLASCFKQLGDGHVEKLTRSYGTQAGSAKYNLTAQIREAERKGDKLMSLEEYRKQEAERKARAALPSPPPKEDAPDGGKKPPAASPSRGVGLTEEDVSFGLEVLPKLMNLQTVQLMKGDLHLSTKALEGYMGFHHLLLSILRQYPNLQHQVEQKVSAFVSDEQCRTKKACPNIGEFLCLFAVSRKYTWDDVSTAVLKETLDRNAGWVIDKFPVLAEAGVKPESRLEKTFRASIVSIRLLCFNVWFLRNIVFKKYGEMATVQSIVADKAEGRAKKNCVDRKWEEYEERKGIPKPYEVDLLQEQMRNMMHGNGLNSWTDYFVNLNLKPLKANDLAYLLRMSLEDAVRKGYIPLWKLRPKAPKEKASSKNDHMGADVDKFDDMFTKSGGSNRY